MSAPHIVVIDNYDSFTYNLVHALAAAGARTTVVRNDAVSRDEVAALGPDGLVFSPGPGHPAVPRDFGVCADLITNPLDVPVLGVCLGMQGLAHHTGGRVVPAPEIVHGSASPARLQGGSPLFAGLGDAVDVGRYHSLLVDADSLPAAWRPLAATETGLLMAMEHKERPWYGVQFHPESILTPDGDRMVANFVGACR
ncbi:MAG: anthranilate synthase component II [Thermoplasmatota archaeon]